MIDDPDARFRSVPALGTKIAFLAAIPFLMYGIFLLVSPITDVRTVTGAVFECGTAISPPSDGFQQGACGTINSAYLYQAIAFIAAALGIAGLGAVLFGFDRQVEHAVPSRPAPRYVDADDDDLSGGARRRLLDDGPR